MTYEDFKEEIYKITNINLSYYKEKQMKRRINSIIKKNKFEGYSDFLPALKTNKKLYDEFINYLTINVSEFYRNPEQWEVLEKEILPQMLSEKKDLKIWSAACSTGDEPYTLAMILNKFIPLSRIKIIATDIDLGAIEKAKTGTYIYKSLEKLPHEYLNKHFVKTDQIYKIKDELRRCVEFKQLNLLKDPYPNNCDLIVCRNVLIYFTDEAKNIVYTKMSRVLNDKGVLFVGSTEQIMTPAKYNFAPIRVFFYKKT